MAPQEIELEANAGTYTQADDRNQPNDSDNYLKGLKLHVLTLALCLTLFLATLELSIVSTALIAITDSLKSYDRVSWIVTAYFLTYSSLLIIWAKVSDIFGRKVILIISVSIFVAFSAGCGASQTIDQLIICRAFQGIGASGLYALVMIIFFEMVPPSKYPAYTAVVSLVFSVSFFFGPLIGGAINNTTTWRWVFLLNVPAGSLAIVLVILTLPTGFPHQGLDHVSNGYPSVLSWALVSRIDFLGASLLLASSIFLISALQKAADGMAWTRPLVLVLIILCGPAFAGFLFWERYITNDRKWPEPVFPWRFITNRVRVGLIINTFLTGFCLTVLMIQLPQRFQSVNGTTPLGAGIHILPYTMFSPLGTILSAQLMSKYKFPPAGLLSFGAIFQTVGIVLLSTLSRTKSIQPAQYGYQILAGFGNGISVAITTLLVPPTVEKRDIAVGTSAIVQFRLLGGMIGVALVTYVMNSSIHPKLMALLPRDDYQALLKSTSLIETFQPAVQATVRAIYADGYNLQMKITIGFAAAQVPLALLAGCKRRSDDI